MTLPRGIKPSNSVQALPKLAHQSLKMKNVFNWHAFRAELCGARDRSIPSSFREYKRLTFKFPEEIQPRAGFLDPLGQSNCRSKLEVCLPGCQASICRGAALCHLCSLHLLCQWGGVASYSLQTLPSTQRHVTMRVKTHGACLNLSVLSKWRQWPDHQG